MFKASMRRKTISKIYINTHVIENFSERKTQDIDLTLPKEVQMFFLVQRSKDKNQIKMSELRGVIQLKNKLFMLLNIYESPNGELIGKCLTILTLKQLNGASYNFPGLGHLPHGVLTDRPEMIKEEIYFDLNIYKNHLKTIEWCETDLNYV